MQTSSNSNSTAASRPSPQRRLSRASTEQSKAAVARYTYRGGETRVMGGGVKLGGVTSTSAQQSPAPTQEAKSSGRTQLLPATLPSIDALHALLARMQLNEEKHNNDNDDSQSETDYTVSSRSSSRLSGFSFQESLTSLSSISTPLSSALSSPVSKTSELPLALEKPAGVYVSPRVGSQKASLQAAQAPSAPSAPTSQPPKHLSRSQRRLARASVDQSKATVARYLYQGGETKVMTGGVMLSGVKPNSAPAAASTKVQPRTTNTPSAKIPKQFGSKQTKSTRGADSDNWRRANARV